MTGALATFGFLSGALVEWLPNSIMMDQMKDAIRLYK